MSKYAAARKSPAPASPRHTLLGGDGDSVTFEDGSNHPCAEDHDGPVMLVTHSADGETHASLVVVEKARELYAHYARRG
jgi:predicted alpha/beta-fold hydrolase